jgi:hypothetical protein
MAEFHPNQVKIYQFLAKISTTYWVKSNGEGFGCGIRVPVEFLIPGLIRLFVFKSVKFHRTIKEKFKMPSL